MALVAAAEGFLPTQRPLPPVLQLESPTRAALFKYSPVIFPRYGSVELHAFSNNNNNNINPKPGGGLDIDPGLKLLLCILIDFVGVASFAAPGLGEATDVAWAPISAVLVNYLFGNGVFTALAFVEELLPGFDIIPTATIAWFVENGKRVDAIPPPQGSNTPPPPPPPKERSYNSPQSPRNTPENSSKRPTSSDVIDVEVVD